METDDSFPTHGYGNNYDVAASFGRSPRQLPHPRGVEYSRSEKIRIRDLPGGACPLELPARAR